MTLSNTEAFISKLYIDWLHRLFLILTRVHCVNFEFIAWVDHLITQGEHRNTVDIIVSLATGIKYAGGREKIENFVM